MVDIEGTKVWEDQSNKYLTRPGDLELTLFADGEPMDAGLASPEWDKRAGTDAWTYRFSGLPRYKVVNGRAVDIVYTVKETPVADYKLDTTNGTRDENGDITGADFANTLYTISLKGSKTWNDQGDKYLTRPENLKLTLLADGKPVSLKPGAVLEPKWVKANREWHYEYTGLPRYTKGTSIPIVYTVVEEKIPGYYADAAQAEGWADQQGNVTEANFTNTLETVSVKGSKTWVDNNNSRGRRPSELILTLYADGKEMELKAGQSLSLTWDKPGSIWTFEYSGLPRYKVVRGKAVPIVYTVKEKLMNRYRPTITAAIGGKVDSLTGNVTGIDFTNTYDPDYVVPKTGDMIWLPLSLMALSGAALFILWRRRKRALAK